MKRKLRIILFLVMVFFNISAVSASISKVTVSGEYNYDYASDILKLVNEERKKENLSTLQMDGKLTSLAMERAKELSVYYGHTRPNGEAWYSIMKVSKGETYGENAAIGYLSPSAVMKDWMASPSHQVNIMKKEYKSMGVGYYKNGIYTYWVQIFSTEEASSEKIPSGKVIEKSGTVSISSKNVALTVAWSKNVNPISLNIGDTIEPIQVQLNNLGWTYANTIISKEDLTWKSSDESVFTVDKTGKITAKGNGLAVLIVSLGDVTKQYQVKVGTCPITSVSLNKSNVDLELGKTTTLKATINPTKTTEDKKLTWKSSNENVATVDINGVVTAKGVGVATITVTTSNGKKAVTQITVKNSITSISLNKTNISLEKNQTVNLLANISPFNTTSNKSLIWKSSDESVATVDINGVVTAKGAGVATITVTTSNNKKATAKVIVSKVSKEDITYSNIEDKTYTGQQIKPSVTLKYKDKVLIEGIDYTLSYGENKLVGEGTVKITFEGDYEGTKILNFDIVPKKVTIRSLKSISTIPFPIYYLKTLDALRYQIVYQVIGLKEWEYVSNIAGLSSKKVYDNEYAYKSVSGIKYYGL